MQSVEEYVRLSADQRKYKDPSDPIPQFNTYLFPEERLVYAAIVMLGNYWASCVSLFMILVLMALNTTGSKKWKPNEWSLPGSLNITLCFAKELAFAQNPSSGSDPRSLTKFSITGAIWKLRSMKFIGQEARADAGWIVAVILIILSGSMTPTVSGGICFCGNQRDFPAAVRLEDIVCRYGGEEFLLICRGASLETSERKSGMGLVEQRAAVQDFPISKKLLQVTVSVGVAVIPDHGRELEAAIHARIVRYIKAKENRKKSNYDRGFRSKKYEKRKIIQDKKAAFCIISWIDVIRKTKESDIFQISGLRRKSPSLFNVCKGEHYEMPILKLLKPPKVSVFLVNRNRSPELEPSSEMPGSGLKASADRGVHRWKVKLPSGTHSSRVKSANISMPGNSNYTKLSVGKE